MTRFIRKLAILANTEVTYGTDVAPTGAANAMQMTNVQYEPSLGEEVSRDLLLPYMGHQGVILTGEYCRIRGEVEIAGAGAAGDAPAYGPLLKACGMSETIDAGVDVVYAPVSSAFDAASVYYNDDGVNHVMLGARGTFTLSLVPKQIPRFTFTLTGLKGTVADTALPTVDTSGFVKPVAVSKANTAFSLHGYQAIMESLSMDIAAQIEPRLLVNHESIQLVDRQMTGQAVLEAVALATKDWLAISQAGTRDALSAVHGTVAGNIMQFDAPKVQIGRPSYGESQKIRNNTLPLMFTPDAGGDEFTITVK